MKKFVHEFKEFIFRGNVMNLAVGVIIGAAFQNVVTSLTNNILSPIIGLTTGQNFDSLELNIIGVSLKYGAFITSVINFLTMAVIVFLMVKMVNGVMTPFKKEPPAAAPTTRKCPYCMSEINIKATRCPSCTSEVEAAAE